MRRQLKLTAFSFLGIFSLFLVHQALPHHHHELDDHIHHHPGGATTGSAAHTAGHGHHHHSESPNHHPLDVLKMLLEGHSHSSEILEHEHPNLITKPKTKAMPVVATIRANEGGKSWPLLSVRAVGNPSSKVGSGFLNSCFLRGPPAVI